MWSSSANAWLHPNVLLKSPEKMILNVLLYRDDGLPIASNTEISLYIKIAAQTLVEFPMKKIACFPPTPK